MLIDSEYHFTTKQHLMTEKINSILPGPNHSLRVCVIEMSYSLSNYYRITL